MRIPVLILVFMVSGLLLMTAGCDTSPKVPGTNQPAYPVAINDSPDRHDRAEKDWKRMLDAYNVPETAPDFYPITWAPRSLPGIKDGIKIMAYKAAAKETQDSALREAAKSFVQRWQDLTVAEPAGISLTEASQAGDLTKLTYREMSYPFPIAGSFGQMTLTVGADGTLRQLDDKFIPVVDLPTRPTIDRETALGSIVGRTLTSTDSSGKAEQVKVNSKSDITGARLVVLPIEKGTALEVHLAWQLTGGKPTQWTLYVDAINGGVLTHINGTEASG
jgi:hypothetical protein